MSHAALLWTFLFAAWLMLTPSQDPVTALIGGALASLAALALAAQLAIVRPAADALGSAAHILGLLAQRFTATAQVAIDAAFGAAPAGEIHRYAFDGDDVTALEKLGAAPSALVLANDGGGALVHALGAERAS